MLAADPAITAPISDDDEPHRVLVAAAVPLVMRDRQPPAAEQHAGDADRERSPRGPPQDRQQLVRARGSAALPRVRYRGDAGSARHAVI